MSEISNFLFHRVHPQRDHLWDPMDVDLFEKCIKYISSKYQTILLEELVLNKKISNGKKIATIVFDDGYKDNIEYAIPILEKYNMKASFYVVTNCIDKNIPTWTYILDHTFQETKNTKIDLNFEFLPSELRVNELSTKNVKLDYVKRLKPIIKKLSHSQRQHILSTIKNSFDDVVVPAIMMDWKDLQEIKNAGHYIGSHTVNHFMLGTMENETDIKYELTASGNRIKEKLGYFPLTISYPVGSYNNTTMLLSEKAGYKIGLAVNQKTYNPALEGLFQIPRIELYNESWFKTKLRINNIYSRVAKVVKSI
jgi:peptidoglycan/xylan/chitin deacetylase (PgdA/CDA1 family)